MIEFKDTNRWFNDIEFFIGFEGDRKFYALATAISTSNEENYYLIFDIDIKDIIYAIAENVK